MHVAFALHENLPSITKSWTLVSAHHQTFAAGSFSFKDERWRLNVLVEGLCRVRKAALRVSTVVELYRDVEHDKVRGGDPSARPRLEQRARRCVRSGRSCRELPGQCRRGR